MDQFRIDSWNSFIELAVDQAALVASFSTATLGFCLLIILQAFGIRDGEITARIGRTRLLYWAIGLSATSVILAFGMRMASVGHYYGLGAKGDVLDEKEMSSLGTTLTTLATAQLIVACLAAGLTILWVLRNRQDLDLKEGTQ